MTRSDIISKSLALDCPTRAESEAIAQIKESFETLRPEMQKALLADLIRHL